MKKSPLPDGVLTVISDVCIKAPEMKKVIISHSLTPLFNKHVLKQVNQRFSLHDVTRGASPSH